MRRGRHLRAPHPLRGGIADYEGGKMAELDGTDYLFVDGTKKLIDATPRGGEPGTVYVIEVDAGRAAGVTPDYGRAGQTGETPLLDAQGMQPDVVFGMLDLLGAEAGRVHVQLKTAFGGTSIVDLLVGDPLPRTC
jgi:hydrogenase maturation protease